MHLSLVFALSTMLNEKTVRVKRQNSVLLIMDSYSCMFDFA